jgi:protein-tyrosine-phosphatase
MAEVLFRDLAARTAPEEPWRVASAGTWATPGLPATEYSRREVQQRGLDLSRHASQPASCDLLADFDLVLTMEKQHQLDLVSSCPAHAHRVHRLSEIVRGEFDIADPYGGPQVGYQTLAETLAQLLADGFPTIRRLAGEAGGRVAG